MHFNEHLHVEDMLANTEGFTGQLNMSRYCCLRKIVRLVPPQKREGLKIPNEQNSVLTSKFCSVTYLDFFHARTIHDGTSN